MPPLAGLLTGCLAVLPAWLAAGRYDYSKHREGEEGEDVNKDDAGEDLQDALAEP